MPDFRNWRPGDEILLVNIRPDRYALLGADPVPGSHQQYLVRVTTVDPAVPRVRVGRSEHAVLDLHADHCANLSAGRRQELMIANAVHDEYAAPWTESKLAHWSRIVTWDEEAAADFLKRETSSGEEGP